MTADRPSFRSEAAKVLKEMAWGFWHLDGNSPGLTLNRLHAINLHAKAIKLEAGIMDDEL